MNIQTNHVSFRYGRKKALSDVSFCAPGGKITYLAGRNGSGKTTWILLSTGLLRLKEGNIHFDGYRFEKVRPNVSVAFDTSPLYPGLSVLDNLSYLYAIDVRSPRIRLLLADLSLPEDLLLKKASRLSYGQQHRAGIAGALLRKADYYILDEPDLGLDPMSWEKTASRLIRMKEEGKCILLTGQHFESFSSLIDHVVILEQGRILFEGEILDFLTEWSMGTGDLKQAFSRILAAQGTEIDNPLPDRR